MSINMEKDFVQFLVLVLVLAACWKTSQAQITTTTPPPGTPIIRPFTRPYNIHEDTIVETSIVRVDCTNPGDACLCNVGSMNPPGPFVVWKKPGSSEFDVYYTGVAGGEKLSFKKTPTYFMQIVCRNTANTARSNTLLEIDVQQNQAPVIQNRNYPDDKLILDTLTPVPAGIYVYNVSATDAENDPLTYSLKTSPAVNYFTIGASDGMIKTLVDLRTATQDTITLTVTVTDGYNVVDNFEIHTTIQNLNTRPEITNLPDTVTIPETTPSGYILTTLTLQDPDPYVNQLIPTCTVVPPAEQYKFVYEPGTRRIRLATPANAPMPLDYEKTNQYKITCVLSDGFLESQSDVLTVNVENVNEPPYFDEVAYYCDLYESAAGVSSCDIDAVIVDPESDVISSVAFQNGNNSQRFRYDRSQSKITFNVDYDVDQNLMPMDLVLQLVATDSVGASSKVPVYIHVNDVNDNTCNFGPTSTNTFNADQGTQLGSLGTLQATDADITAPNNQLTYETIRALPADSTNYIAAYPDGSLAYVGLIPEQNNGKSYSLVVRCKDGGSPQRTAEGTIVLTYQTTTTTSTSTTTTPTTTTTTTTTKKPASEDIWDNDAFVAIFAILMSLLIAGLLVGLYFLLRALGLFGGLGALGSMAGTTAVVPYEEGAAAAAAPARGGLCGPNNGCSNFCCPRPPPPPEDDYFNTAVRTNNDFRDSYWKSGDHFETGTGYNAQGDRYASELEGGHRILALPAPPPRKMAF